MEREILLTGIGGQGVQLAAQVLARAAALEDRYVTYLGTYGGTMRGGNTDSTLVVGDAPISTPPIVSRAWAALAMHHQFWEPLRAKLRPGGVAMVNAPAFEGELDRERHSVFEVPATQIAAKLGGAMASSLVLASAFAATTALVGLPSLVEAMRASLPPYRRQHAALNEAALGAGFEAGSPGAAPAWPNGGGAPA